MSYSEAQFNGDAAQYPFHFLPYASLQFYDGSAAHLPWLQELPDPMTSAMWSSWVEINPQTAAKLNIGQGDIVEVAPPFDGPGQITALLAANLMFEFLCALARPRHGP